MTLTDFLVYLTTSAGAGVAVFSIIAYMESLRTLTSAFKFWAAIALSWILPFLGYAGLVLLKMQQLSFQSAFLVAGTAYTVSQGIHKVQEIRQQSQASKGAGL
jgi:hypothetical protein